MENLTLILISIHMALFVSSQQESSNELLLESAYSTAEGQKIINPGKFVELIKNTNPGN
jgi:hypothetical protein